MEWAWGDRARAVLGRVAGRGGGGGGGRSVYIIAEFEFSIFINFWTPPIISGRHAASRIVEFI